jgi:predicted O-methyltransferase YrrM
LSCEIGWLYIGERHEESVKGGIAVPIEWTPEKLHQVSAAFQECRILLTAAELDLFSKLKDRPRSVKALAEEEKWDPRALRILMDALAAQGLLSKSRDGIYTVEEPMTTALANGTEKSILPMILHRAHMWRTWSNLTEIVRTGVNPSVVTRESRSTGEMRDFIGAMHVIGRTLAEEVATSIDLRPYKRMIDLGGGSGTYTIAFLKQAPHMTATLFDLPEVVDLARERLSEEGYLNRVNLVAGDYFADEFPEGHDLVLLSAIIHSNGRQENRDIYTRALRCLIPGGTILIRDHIMDESRTNPLDGAIFAVNMLAATPAGDTYTFEEVREDLEDVGFKDVRMIRHGEHMDQLVAARK